MDGAARIQWPDDDQPPPRPDWRDTLTAATDLAVFGFVVVAAALPVVTIGAALATGSYGARWWVGHRGFPPFADLGRRYLRALLPGVAALAAVLLAGLLVVFDLSALARGAVPGGTVLVVATWVVVLWLLAVVVLTVVELGREPDRGWLAAVRWAVGITRSAPLRAVAPTAVCLLAGALALMVPVTAPLVLGYGLFAMHVVADRVLPAD